MTRAGLALGAVLMSCAPAPTRANLSYDDRWGAATTLDFFAGVGDAPASGRPAVMLVHGGGWYEGSKTQHHELAVRLAGQGYAVASIDYRLVPAGAYPAAVQDVRCALAYWERHAVEFDFDPNRVAVLGYSAGAHLVSLLGTAPDVEATRPDCAAGVNRVPRAVIAGAAPHDLVALSYGTPVRRFLNGLQEEVPARYLEASPRFHVKPGLPPFLLIHGRGDLVAPETQSIEMRDALVAAGNDAQLLLLNGGGHLINPGITGDQLTYEAYSLDGAEAWLAIRDFLERTVAAP